MQTDQGVEYLLFFSPAAGTMTRTTAMERKTFTTQRSRSTWTVWRRVCPTSRPPPQPRLALHLPSHHRSPTSLILKTSMWMVSRTTPQRCSASQLPLHSATSAPTTPTRYTRARNLDTELQITGAGAAVQMLRFLPCEMCRGRKISEGSLNYFTPTSVWEQVSGRGKRGKKQAVLANINIRSHKNWSLNIV